MGLNFTGGCLAFHIHVLFYIHMYYYNVVGFSSIVKGIDNFQWLIISKIFISLLIYFQKIE